MRVTGGAREEVTRVGVGEWVGGRICLRAIQQTVEEVEMGAGRAPGRRGRLPSGHGSGIGGGGDDGDAGRRDEREEKLGY